MLRDEAEGITFDPIQTDPLAEAAGWVDWASASATANASSWGTNNDDTRWNLAQFWKLKNEHYAENPEAWDRLDLRAHKAWAALAELGMVKDNPPAQKRYQDEAQKAYAGAAAAANRLGLDAGVIAKNSQESAAWFDQAKKYGVDDRLSAAVSDRAKELLGTPGEFLGIPTWAWGLAAVGLVVLMVKR